MTLFLKKIKYIKLSKTCDLKDRIIGNLKHTCNLQLFAKRFGSICKKLVRIGPIFLLNIKMVVLRNFVCSKYITTTFLAAELVLWV